MNTLVEFFVGTLYLVFRGGKKYYAWMASLAAVALVGMGAWVYQLQHGLIITGMRDPVSWGLYIGNFTFLVGVAAAAVLLVIPAYIYKWGPIKEIVLLGELLAVAAICMCLMFVTFDLGRPDRFWHLIPGWGILNFPISMLAWDVVVLQVYLAINLCVPVYILYSAYQDREPNHSILWPLILFSIPAAVSIHTVTAFLYNGFPSRPFWNASILAPRFIASAFCSGPSFIIIAFQLIRQNTAIKIQDRAIFKLAEIVAYAMGINLFLLIAEMFKEYYGGTVHMAPMQYLFEGLHGHNDLVPFIWTAQIFNVSAFLVFLIPGVKQRVNFTNNEGGADKDTAGGLAAITMGVLLLTTPVWAGSSHTFQGVNWVHLLQTELNLSGILLIGGGLAILMRVVIGIIRHESTLAKIGLPSEK